MAAVFVFESCFRESKNRKNRRAEARHYIEKIQKSEKPKRTGLKTGHYEDQLKDYRCGALELGDRRRCWDRSGSSRFSFCLSVRYECAMSVWLGRCRLPFRST